MGRRYITVAFLLITSCAVFGQKITMVKELLTKRNFRNLDLYLTEISPDKSVHYNQTINRQIVSSFNECVIHLKEGDNFYKILLLTFDDRIVFFKLDLCVQKNFDEIKTIRNEGKYMNTDSLKLFQHEYFLKYKRTVNVSDFFNDNIVFGERCGWASFMPEYRVKLNKLIKSRNIKKLDYWLTSPVTEIQIYAVDGFYQLKETGYKLTSKEHELISFIKSKHGNVRTCSGCSFFTWPLDETVKDFSF